jgi:hypothetical protein
MGVESDLSFSGLAETWLADVITKDLILSLALEKPQNLAPLIEQITCSLFHSLGVKHAEE